MIDSSPHEFGVADYLMQIEGVTEEISSAAHGMLAMASALPTATMVSATAHAVPVRPIAVIGPAQTLNSVRKLALPGVDTRSAGLGVTFMALNDTHTPSLLMGGVTSDIGATPAVSRAVKYPLMNEVCCMATAAKKRRLSFKVGQVSQTNMPPPENRLQKLGMPPKANCPTAAKCRSRNAAVKSSTNLPI